MYDHDTPAYLKEAAVEFLRSLPGNDQDEISRLMEEFGVDEHQALATFVRLTRERFEQQRANAKRGPGRPRGAASVRFVGSLAFQAQIRLAELTEAHSGSQSDAVQAALDSAGEIDPEELKELRKSHTGNRGQTPIAVTPSVGGALGKLCQTHGIEKTIYLVEYILLKTPLESK